MPSVSDGSKEGVFERTVSIDLSARIGASFRYKDSLNSRRPNPQVDWCGLGQNHT